MAREMGGKLGRSAGPARQRSAPAALQRRAEPVMRREEERPVALQRGGSGRGGYVATSRTAPAAPVQQPVQTERRPQKDYTLQPREATIPKGGDDNKPNPNGTIPVGGDNKRKAAGTIPRGGDGDQQKAPGTVPGFNPTLKPKPEDKRGEVQAGFQSNRVVTVREATPEEWASYTPEQQQAIITNYALYQASQADKEAGLTTEDADESYFDTVNSVFGEGGGSDTYAPNTLRLLTELGYQDQTGDLDNFLNGQAVAGLSTIQGLTGDTERTGAAGVAERLASSAVFDSPELTASLQQGAALLDAIRVNQSLTPEFMSYAGTGPSLQGLSEMQLADLNTTLNNMSNRGVWNLIQEDEESNTSLRADLDKLVGELGQETVTSYFANQLQGFSGDDVYMSFDEFTQNWLGK